MKKDSFAMAMSHLLPDCTAAAISEWVDFASECVDSEQFVDFIPEKDKTIAIERWLGCIYAGLYFVKKEFGEKLAGQIGNISLMGCIYPDEMKPAAAFLQRGGDIDKVAQLAVDGEFDGPPPYFPRLDDVVDDMNIWAGQCSEQEVSTVNFFEQELRKLTEHGAALSEKVFAGRVCFGKLSDNLRVRVEFVTQGTANHYEAIQASVINRTEGIVDRLTLRFADLLGKKKVSNPNFSEGIVPYVWKYGDEIDWYVYKPTKADYEQISKALNVYLDMFHDPVPEMKQRAHNEKTLTMQSL